MNKDDIQQFIKAFVDFTKHAEVEEMKYNTNQEYLAEKLQSKLIIENEIEKKAAELEVTVDYYMAEFM